MLHRHQHKLPSNHPFDIVPSPSRTKPENRTSKRIRRSTSKNTTSDLLKGTHQCDTKYYGSDVSRPKKHSAFLETSLKISSNVIWKEDYIMKNRELTTLRRATGHLLPPLTLRLNQWVEFLKRFWDVDAIYDLVTCKQMSCTELAISPSYFKKS